MKKFSVIIGIILVSVSVFLLGFDANNNQLPNTYYQVYLDEKVIGTIKSKSELERYINAEGNYIKEKYNVKNVYAPNGLEIKKVNTYVDEVDDVKKVYKIIEQERPFTIKGYQFSLKGEETNKKIYVIKEEIFKQAVEEVINIFVGTENYQAYLNDEQSEIETTGTIIQNVYVEEDITIKETQIPVDETIYTDVQELTQYLVFGDEISKTTYNVQVGDTIASVAFNNKISVEEFMISNPEFTSSTALLYPGQEVTIGITNPQIRIVEEAHTVRDAEIAYRIEEKEDKSLYVGEEKLIQAGENGLERITENTRTVNGIILQVDTEGREVLKQTINKVVAIGSYSVPSVGSLTNWAWPTNSGYVIMSDYEWRINPISYKRELHDGLDIAGTGYGSPIYAANNGTVIESGYHYMNGYYITIDHGNTYYTIYAHMSELYAGVGQVVAKGQQIGAMGASGWATGTHLHYSVFIGKPFYGGYSISPWSIY